MHAKTKTLIVVSWATAMGLTAFAGGAKRTAEPCIEDGECARGHCYTKQDNSAKVCLDCTSSEVSNYRGQIQRFCKDEPRGCSKIPPGDEVSEDFFKVRIENNERCITARENENRACWNGGDAGHQRQVDETQGTRRICLEEWNTRKGIGGLYTCSDSTYATRASEVTDACNAYGDACKAWQKDDRIVDCGEIETAMKKTDRCVDAIERLDNDCLPRLSPFRETQFAKAKRSFDSCKDLLEFKKDKKLCK